MCYRNQNWGIALLACGVGFILSCLIGSCVLRLLIGIALVIVSLFVYRP